MCTLNLVKKTIIYLSVGKIVTKLATFHVLSINIIETFDRFSDWINIQSKEYRLIDSKSGLVPRRWSVREKNIQNVPRKTRGFNDSPNQFHLLHTILNSLRDDERNASFRRRDAIESSAIVVEYACRWAWPIGIADRVIERNEGSPCPHRHARRRRSRAHTVPCACELRAGRVDLGGKRMNDTWPNH